MGKAIVAVLKTRPNSILDDIAQLMKMADLGDALNVQTTTLLKDNISTSLKPPYTHYGYGVWIDKSNDQTKKFFVEGYDPGVALRSVVYPAEDEILTIIGNTAEALDPLYDLLEEFLGLK